MAQVASTARRDGDSGRDQPGYLGSGTVVALIVSYLHPLFSLQTIFLLLNKTVEFRDLFYKASDRPLPTKNL